MSLAFNLFEGPVPMGEDVKKGEARCQPYIYNTSLSTSKKLYGLVGYD